MVGLSEYANFFKKTLQNPAGLTTTVSGETQSRWQSPEVSPAQWTIGVNWHLLHHHHLASVSCVSFSLCCGPSESRFCAFIPVSSGGVSNAPSLLSCVCILHRPIKGQPLLWSYQASFIELQLCYLKKKKVLGHMPSPVFLKGIKWVFVASPLSAYIFVSASKPSCHSLASQKHQLFLGQMAESLYLV